jgi:hypothetical protein
MGTDTRRYKQPRRLNAVSVTLLLLVLIAGYVAFSAWPVFRLNGDVKNAAEDALPRLYRANLLPEPESTIASDQVRKALTEKLSELGIADPESALVITRDARTVAITVNVAAAIDLKLVHKKLSVRLNPRVETSAEQVSF